MDKHLLIATADCQSPAYICGWGVTGKWQFCKSEGLKHFKATGHAVRIEQIRTILYI